MSTVFKSRLSCPCPSSLDQNVDAVGVAIRKSRKMPLNKRSTCTLGVILCVRTTLSNAMFATAVCLQRQQSGKHHRRIPEQKCRLVRGSCRVFFRNLYHPAARVHPQPQERRKKYLQCVQNPNANHTLRGMCQAGGRRSFRRRFACDCSVVL